MSTGNLFCCNCLQLLSPPIKQCSNKHSICGKCQPKGETSACPKCANRLYAVPYEELEKVIAQLNKEKVTFPCAYESKGCSYKFEQDKKLVHEAECKFRSFQCEGKRYCGWKCDWVGKYDQLLDHFKDNHDCGMNYKVDRALKVNFENDSFSLEPIDYFDGCALFWYKQKVDVSLQMVYWVIQYVGLQKDACQYYYEFEIHDGPTRKIKITEFCESDSMDANSIFKSGQCVALPFSSVKSFLSMEGYLYFRFRVMKVKKPSTAKNDEENSELKKVMAQISAPPRPNGIVPPPRFPTPNLMALRGIGPPPLYPNSMAQSRAQYRLAQYRSSSPPIHSLNPRRTDHDAQNHPSNHSLGKKRSNK